MIFNCTNPSDDCNSSVVVLSQAFLCKIPDKTTCEKTNGGNPKLWNGHVNVTMNQVQYFKNGQLNMLERVRTQSSNFEAVHKISPFLFSFFLSNTQKMIFLIVDVAFANYAYFAYIKK